MTIEEKVSQIYPLRISDTLAWDKAGNFVSTDTARLYLGIGAFWAGNIRPLPAKQRAKCINSLQKYLVEKFTTRLAPDDKTLDAVSIATPNHWHSLMAIWACQAGKDVYVEKPCSHNVFEGRKVLLQGGPRRIATARIFVPEMLRRRRLHIGRRQVDRRHDGAGAWIRHLACMNGAGGEIEWLA